MRMPNHIDSGFSDHATRRGQPRGTYLGVIRIDGGSPYLGLKYDGVPPDFVDAMPGRSTIMAHAG